MDRKENELPAQPTSAPAYVAPVDRDAVRRRILGKKPSPELIANAKRVLRVLAITDAHGRAVNGEPAKGAFTIELTKKSDGRAIAELLDLCHALWPDATFVAKE